MYNMNKVAHNFSNRKNGHDTHSLTLSKKQNGNTKPENWLSLRNNQDTNNFSSELKT